MMAFINMTATLTTQAKYFCHIESHMQCVTVIIGEGLQLAGLLHSSINDEEARGDSTGTRPVCVACVLSFITLTTINFHAR